MSTIATFRTMVLSIVKTQLTDTGQLDITAGGDVDLAIAAALKQHQKIRPYKPVVEITGTGAFDYSLTATSPIVADWKPGFSRVDELVFPYVSTDQRPTALDDDEFAVIGLPAGYYLRFTQAIPSTAQKFLLTYTTPHVVNVSGSTIPEVDEEAVAQLAAAHTFRKLAAYVTNTVEGAISADSVNRSKTDLYLSLASKHEKVWLSLIEGEAAAIGVGVAVDSDPSFADAFGTQLFFHNTRRH